MDWEQEYKRQKNDAIARIKAWLNYKKSNDELDAILIEYSGYGDSANDMYAGNAKVPREILDSLWDLLPCGFVNDAGGQGIITLNPEDQSIIIDHQDNITEVECSSFIY